MSNRAQYGCIPAFWIEQLHTLTEARVAIALASYANTEGRAFVSQSLIADRAGVSQPTASRTLAKLIDRGLVSSHGGPRHRQEYHLRITRQTDSPHESPLIHKPARRESALFTTMRDRESVSDVSHIYQTNARERAREDGLENNQGREDAAAFRAECRKRIEAMNQRLAAS